MAGRLDLSRAFRGCDVVRAISRQSDNNNGATLGQIPRFFRIGSITYRERCPALAPAYFTISPMCVSFIQRSRCQVQLLVVCRSGFVSQVASFFQARWGLSRPCLGSYFQNPSQNPDWLRSAKPHMAHKSNQIPSIRNWLRSAENATSFISAQFVSQNSRSSFDNFALSSSFSAHSRLRLAPPP